MAGQVWRRSALVFPGQGSQRVGMAKEFLENWRRVFTDTYEEASEAMQFNLLRLVSDGPQDQLTETQYAQPAILTQSIAMLRILQHEAGLQVTTTDGIPCALGHSLGEYSALVAANAIAFADAVSLVVR